MASANTGDVTRNSAPLWRSADPVKRALVNAGRLRSLNLAYSLIFLFNSNGGSANESCGLPSGNYGETTHPSTETAPDQNLPNALPLFQTCEPCKSNTGLRVQGEGIYRQLSPFPGLGVFAP